MLVLDDVQTLFKGNDYKNIQEYIINSILIPLRDKNEAVIFLVTSDYSIESGLSRLSGMSSRLKTFPFPKIEKTEFEKYIQKELINLQKINRKLTLEFLLKFYEDFNTDIRTLNEFIKTFDGDYEGINKKF